MNMARVKTVEELEEEIKELREKLQTVRAEIIQLLMAGLSSTNNRMDRAEEWISVVSTLARTSATVIQGHIEAVLPANESKVSKKIQNEGVEVK